MKSLLRFLPQGFGPQVALLVEEAVSGAEHAELGAAVQGVAHLLLFGWQGQDIRQGKGVALVEEGIGFEQFAVDHLGHLLAVAAGGEAVAGNAVLHEIVHHALGTPLRETQVVVVVAAIVAVGGQFDGDVRIFRRQRGHVLHQIHRTHCAPVRVR